MRKLKPKHQAGDLVTYKAGATTIDGYFLTQCVVVEVEGKVVEPYYPGGFPGEYWYYSVLSFDGKILRVREDNLSEYDPYLNEFRQGLKSEYGLMAKQRIAASRHLVELHGAISRAARSGEEVAA